MDFKAQFKQQLLTNATDFRQLALLLFNYQAEHNPVYKQYLQHLQVKPDQITNLTQIPFLPIEFFKLQKVVTGNFEPQATFLSSGTTQQTRSKHYVADLKWYNQVTKYIFEHYYGPLDQFVIVALLPSYLEQGGSSLVAMVDYFVKQTEQQEEGFYLHNHTQLLQSINSAKTKGKKVLLIGVSYALLDWAEELQGTHDFSNVIIMETGGMKGRHREMVREELHSYLKKGFAVDTIHSEYGMTELLSQGYSMSEGIFQPGQTMQILLRDLNDPFDIGAHHRSGGINVIDLANVDSCAFIETKDIGRMHENGTFEVLGRFDNSDIRGCNLLIA